MTENKSSTRVMQQTEEEGSRNTLSRQVSTDVETVESVKRKNGNLKSVPFLQRIQSNYV